MKLYNLALRDSKSSYFLDRFSGSLIQISDSFLKPNSTLPEKIKHNLDFCNEPYLLNNKTIEINKTLQYNDSKSISLSRIASRIIYLCRANLFWLAHKYVSFLKPSFESSMEAICFFRKQTTSLPQSSLCLPRSLFAASASRRFAESGVIFIGIFLPTRSMHAWVIENGQQPDCDDSMWVNFRPVAALC